jgi:hypothetical protein
MRTKIICFIPKSFIFFTFSQKTEHLFENSSNMSHDLGQPRSIFAGVKRKTSVNHLIILKNKMMLFSIVACVALFADELERIADMDME